MRVLAIDPGPTQSALVVFDGERITTIGILPNADVLAQLRAPFGCTCLFARSTVFVAEMVACYGMPVGKEVFQTVKWLGRFQEAWEHRGGEYTEVERPDVKLHICHMRNAGDGNIRQALIDRFGPGRAVAIGTKKQPGPLYGVVKDLWAATAVAVTWWDRRLITESEGGGVTC